MNPLSLPLLLLAIHVSALPTLRPRSLPFSALTGLTTQPRDSSTPPSSAQPEKFFHESTFSPHYDGRFASAQLAAADRVLHLRLLLKSYMDTMNRIGVQTWLVHGCLLGWWWNGGIMPWDTDVDVMVREEGMRELAAWWNMTVHAFSAVELGVAGLDTRGPGDHNADDDDDTGDEAKGNTLGKGRAGAQGKKYLLEVNPHAANPSTRDTQNVIDARWIDTQTGLFIDVTTIHTVSVKPARGHEEEEEEEEAGTREREKQQQLAEASALRSAFLEQDPEDTSLYTKDQHLFSAGQIFPLRTTTFEGIRVRVPYAYESLLLEEYGPEALTETWFNGYQFDRGKKEWVVAEPGDQQALRWEKGGKGGRRGAKKGNSATGRKLESTIAVAADGEGRGKGR
ncbi:mannosyltransferase [Coniothyrium glycines]